MTHISDDLKKQIHQSVMPYLTLAEQAFKGEFSMPSFQYNVRGKVAGKAYLNRWEIRLNPTLLQENQNEFLTQVIPHELAHLITYHQFGRVKPHGKEWQYVMTQVFQKPANTYHQFDVTSVQGQTFAYQCSCRSHALSIRRHNKVQRKQTSYHCRLCKGKLIYQLGPL